MPGLAIRWSEHEARKAYARPFGVSFLDEEQISLGAIAVSGTDLLYYRQFQVAVLTLVGELYHDDAIDADPDPQRCWLDYITGLLPAAAAVRLRPVSLFDPERGRVFHISVEIDGRSTPVAVEAHALVEYQEFQAALAHQSGLLYRDADVEAVAEVDDRRAAWIERLNRLLERPSAAEAMAQRWPWHRDASGGSS